MKLRVMLLGCFVSFGLTQAATHTVSLSASGSPWSPTTPGSFSKAVADAQNSGDTIIFDYTNLGMSPTITLDAAFANFAIGGFVIDGLRGKPVGSDKVKIQGTSGQWNGLLNIENNGTSLIGLDFQPAAGNGVYIKSSGNTIDSCLVHGMAYNGIQIDAGANGNVIKNSLIYGNLRSNPTVVDFAGVYSHGAGTIIDSCFVYDNNANGIIFYNNTADGSSVTNSTIGRDEKGNELGNDFNGIFAWGASNVTTKNCVIVNNGDASQGAPDRISGIRYQSITSGSTITGGVISSNYIGSDSSKTNAGNEFDGVTLHTNVADVIVSDNVIAYNGFGTSGNGGGLAIRVSSVNIEVQGNFIGCHRDSTAAGNKEYGISIESGTSHLIGGSLPSEGNVIAYSSLVNRGKGLWISFVGTSCETYNNLFMGNAKAGIEIQAGSGNNIVGAIGQGNIISGNGTGIIVNGSSTDNNTLRYNSFACNTNGGISLESSGNDNYGNPGTPKGITMNNSEIRANFISGFAPSANSVIDIYLADSICAIDCDNSVAQGMRMVATISASPTASANGLYEWEYDFVAGGDLVNKNNSIVIATELGTAGQVNTSEFSICAPLCNTPTNALIVVDDPDICSGETALLAASADSKSKSEDYSYTWYEGSINPSNIVHYSLNDSLFTVNQEGDYLVMISSQIDSAACKYTSNIQSITITNYPTVTLGEDTSLCFLAGDQISISAFVDTVDPGNLSWSSSEVGILSITVGDTLEYVATFIDQNGCSDADTIKVANACDVPDPELPNVITENSPWMPIGDLTSDQFLESDLVVYDRWGRKMFNSTQLIPVWKGKRNNGNSCSAGVYYWIWTYKDILGDEYNCNGFVQLLKP